MISVSCLCDFSFFFFFIRTRWSCCETITRGNEGSGGNNFSKGFHPWTGWLTFNESLRATLFCKASITSAMAVPRWNEEFSWFDPFDSDLTRRQTTVRGQQMFIILKRWMYIQYTCMTNEIKLLISCHFNVPGILINCMLWLYFFFYFPVKCLWVLWKALYK